MKSFLIPLMVLAVSGAASGAVVFTDDFEYTISNATTYNVANTSGQVNATKWQRTNTGAFGATRTGIVNDDRTGESFTARSGNQAYTNRYSSNTGVTTQFQQLSTSTFSVGDVITVSFWVYSDLAVASNDYTMSLLMFNGAGTRNVVSGTSPYDGAAVTLAMINEVSNGAATTTWTQKSFTFTMGNSVVDDNGGTAGGGTTWNNAFLNYDLAIRFGDGGNHALMDDVVVSIVSVPEPTAAFFGSIGCLLLLRRRKR